MFKNLSKKRLAVLLVSLSLVLVAGIGVTLAYVFASTGGVVNTFTPSHVACAVVEKINGSQTDTQVSAEALENISVKSEVKIQNTGDTEAYIRAAIIVTWKNAEGHVWAQKPVAYSDVTQSGDYLMDINLRTQSEEGWVKGEDGYYYYTAPVAPGYETGILIKQASVTNYNQELKNKGYYVSIEIAASAIQSNLAANPQDAFAKAADPVTAN